MDKKNSPPQYRINNRLLHSIRNPVKEAQRVVSAQIGESLQLQRVHSSWPLKVILVNPGFGFSAIPIREKFPQSRISALYSDVKLFNQVKSGIPAEVREAGCELYLTPDSRSLRLVLGSLLGELDFLGCFVSDWPAGEHIVGHAFLRAGILDYLTELQKGFATRSYFGPRWKRNLVHNRNLLLTQLRISRLGKPLVLCASGPSLEDCLPFFSRARQKLCIWALPSALRALQSQGIIPDAVVASDGGFWAGLHLRHLNKDSLLLYAATAMLPAWLRQKIRSGTIPACQFSQGSALEQYAPELMPYVPRIPERGSVIFSAIDLLADSGAAKVFLAGADFAPRNLASHARPHSFDEYIEAHTNRFNGLTTERWLRSRGDDLKVYRRWAHANADANKWPELRRYSPGTPNIPAINYPGLGDFLMAIEEEIDSLRSPEQNRPAIETTSCPDHVIQSTKTMIQDKTDAITALPPRIPPDLFSNPGNKFQLEGLIISHGIEVKTAYVQWMRSGDEEQSLREAFQYARTE